MNIVIDTNVVISGTFFGGFPRKVLEAVVDKTLSAYATAEIADEYTELKNLEYVLKNNGIKDFILR